MSPKGTGDFELPAIFVFSPKLDAIKRSHRVAVALDEATHVFTASLVGQVDQGEVPRQPTEAGG